MAGTAHALPFWLNEHFQAFLKQFQSDSLSHAVLLSGEQGIGKALLASELATSMLCKQCSELACGECHSCKLALAQTHPDLIVLGPEEGKKIISVDQIRGLMKEVYSTPQICENKVILISPADQLNHNAANALLKCLEEPPSNTYFFLCTAFASRLPPTVRSRCRLKFIESPTNDVARSWLEDQGVSRDDADNRLAVCKGRPLAALEQGEEILARHVAIRSAIDSSSHQNGSVSQLASSLQMFDISALLPAYIVEVLALIKSVHLQEDAAWNAKALLNHLQSVQNIYRSVQAGSTLNPQLATEDMLVNLQKCRQH